MKRDPITGIRYAAVLLLLTAAGCSKDEAPEGNRPSEGLYPLEISAVTLRVEGGEARPWGAQTRVSETTDGSGSAFDAGDTFGVQIEGREESGSYAVQADGSVTAETVVYWPDRNGHNIIAWYPATDGTLALGDQSQKLAYLLYGTASGNSENAVTLTFAHQLAKVRVTPAAEALADIQSLEIRTNTQCTYEKGKLSTSDQAGWVKMKPCTYMDNGTAVTCWEANVVPGYEISQLRVNGTEERTLSAAVNPVEGKFYNITLNKKQLDPYTYDKTTNTYTVNTAEGLAVWANAARTDLSTNCILGASITLKKPADGSSNWTAVGDSNNPYTGTFDGAGFTISNLTIVSSSNDQGLFGRIAGAEIRNLNLQNVNITGGQQQVGGLVGYAALSSRVINCKVSGTVTGTIQYIGGIVGNNAGTIIASSFSGLVSANAYVGGIAGQNRDGIIVGCMADGSIQSSGTNSRSAGGIVGFNYTTIVASASRCQVSASRNFGGIAGNNFNGTIDTCYWDTYDGNGIGNGSGETTKVDGTSVTWATAIEAMNAAIESWNASNTDNPCNYRFTAGEDGRPVIE